MFSKYATALFVGIGYTLFGIFLIPLQKSGTPLFLQEGGSSLIPMHSFSMPWFVIYVLFFYGIFLLLRVITLVSEEYQEKLAEDSIVRTAYLDFLTLINEYCLSYASSLNPALISVSFTTQHAARRTRWTLCFWLAVAAFYCSPYPQSLL